MDEVRAFKKPDAPVSHVVIDERAIAAIKDIAIGLFGQQRGVYDRTPLMFEALARYIAQRGARANFSVVV